MPRPSLPRGKHDDRHATARQPPPRRRPPKTPAELAEEPLADRYLRHIRAAVVFAAAVLALALAFAVIIGTVDGVRAADRANCERELGALAEGTC